MSKDFDHIHKKIAELNIGLLRLGADVTEVLMDAEDDISLLKEENTGLKDKSNTSDYNRIIDLEDKVRKLEAELRRRISTIDIYKKLRRLGGL